MSTFKQTSDQVEQGTLLLLDELKESLLISNANDHSVERANGARFGYPQCCIDEFCEDISDFNRMMVPERTTRKLAGSGYIPCTTCNEKYTVTELVANINARRAITKTSKDTIMSKLTREIIDQLELYVDYDSTVILNKFNVSVVHQTIHTLNYVGGDFIRRHLGIEPIVLNEGGDIVLEIDASDSDYIAIKVRGTFLVIYHDAEETSITIEDIREPGDLGCDDEETSLVTTLLIELMTAINSTYIDGIESKINNI